MFQLQCAEHGGAVELRRGSSESFGKVDLLGNGRQIQVDLLQHPAVFLHICVSVFNDNTNLSNDPFRIGRCFPDNTNARIPQTVFLALGGGSCSA